MAQATTKKERRWALRFNYPNGGLIQYVGSRRTLHRGYRGVGADLTKALLFASEQDALRDMVDTFASYDDRRGLSFPVPVPVDVVAETKPGSVREVAHREVGDGYAVKRIPGDALCFVGDTAIASRPDLIRPTVFASPYAAYEAIAKVGRFLGFLVSSYTVVPVLREPGETAVTITEASRCDCR